MYTAYVVKLEGGQYSKDYSAFIRTHTSCIIYVLGFTQCDLKKQLHILKGYPVVSHYATDLKVTITHQEMQEGRLVASKHGFKQCRFQNF